jgi:hypothetical protein
MQSPLQRSSGHPDVQAQLRQLISPQQRQLFIQMNQHHLNVLMQHHPVSPYSVDPSRPVSQPPFTMDTPSTVNCGPSEASSSAVYPQYPQYTLNRSGGGRPFPEALSADALNDLLAQVRLLRMCILVQCCCTLCPNLTLPLDSLFFREIGNFGNRCVFSMQAPRPLVLPTTPFALPATALPAVRRWTPPGRWKCKPRKSAPAAHPMSPVSAPRNHERCVCWGCSTLVAAINSSLVAAWCSQTMFLL